mmetsp:Transcript_22065/g.24818  ORF Transcript_22065/g.24818 Transcript_22065/m.24818 type:complete len:88 (+) Transcript_22065:100-363(+)
MAEDSSNWRDTLYIWDGITSSTTDGVPVDDTDASTSTSTSKANFLIPSFRNDLFVQNNSPPNDGLNNVTRFSDTPKTSFGILSKISS